MTSNPPPVQQVGGAVIVQGDCLQHLMASVLSLMREMQHNGFAPPPALSDLLTKAHAARMSQPRHELARYEVVEAHSESQDGDDLMDAETVAALMGISTRQVQRLAPGMGAERVGRSWAFRRAPVLALAEQRRSRQ